MDPTRRNGGKKLEDFLWNCLVGRWGNFDDLEPVLSKLRSCGPFIAGN